MTYNSKLFITLIQCDPKVAYTILGIAILAWAFIYGIFNCLSHTLRCHGHSIISIIVNSLASSGLLIIPAAFGINFLVWGAARIAAVVICFIVLGVVAVAVVHYGNDD